MAERLTSKLPGRNPFDVLLGIADEDKKEDISPTVVSYGNNRLSSGNSGGIMRRRLKEETQGSAPFTLSNSSPMCEADAHIANEDD